MKTGDEGIEQKVELTARRMMPGGNVLFTGAGISTESGIPDYRSQGGLWEKFRPIYFQEFMSSKSARIEYWQRKTQLYPRLMKARPNAAHMAIARLHEMGLVEAVITQNVDGLHQESGLPEGKVIELHGNTRRVRCMDCGETFGAREVQERIEAGDLAPECPCGGYLKSDTISFGQPMPEAALERATELSQGCRVFVVVGSTLVVQPAALMPSHAKRNGAFLVIINLSETPYDELCDVLIRAMAGQVLPHIVASLEGLWVRNVGAGPGTG
jgi:NAD-dependent deacetylase